MLEAGRYTPGFAFLDQHNPLRTGNWLREVVHHTQKALKDQNIAHEYHLSFIEKLALNRVKSQLQELVLTLNLITQPSSTGRLNYMNKKQ